MGIALIGSAGGELRWVKNPCAVKIARAKQLAKLPETYAAINRCSLMIRLRA